MLSLNNFIKDGTEYLIGLDEVGRGPLAGPVIACGVLLDSRNVKSFAKIILDLGVTDSKVLSEKKRIKILNDLGIEILKLNCNQIYAFNLFKFVLFSIEPKKIDEINILNASLMAMRECTQILGELVDSKFNIKALIDGNKKFPEISSLNLTQETIVKGDLNVSLIALASIIAKEYRDFLMNQFAKKYPMYNFEKHKGYPTKEHKELIIKYGVSKLHRKSFKGVKEFIH